MSSRKKSISIKSDKFTSFIESRLPTQIFKPVNLESKRHVLEEMTTNFNINIDGKITAKLLLIKKLQKLEKQAIASFYEGNVVIAFQQLQKCLQLLKTEEIVDHKVYIYYLQTEFSFKSKNFKDARLFYEKTTKIMSKLNSSEKSKVKEYIICLQALYTSLLIEEERYHDALKGVETLQDKLDPDSNEKIWRQLKTNKVQIFMGLKQFQRVISLVEESRKEEKNISLRQKVKMMNYLTTSLKECGQIQKAENNIVQFIEDVKKNGEEKSALNKIYPIYLHLFTQDLIKLIYICKNWLLQVESDIPKARLFHLFYQIGDFQEALFYLGEISQNYKKTSEDYQIQAQIKEFYGESEACFYLLNQAVELARSEEKKMKIGIKLLRFEDQSLRKEKQKQIEKKLKYYRFEGWAESVFEEYREYLDRKGQKERIEKLEKILDLQNCAQLRETGKFAFEQKQRKESQKRRYSLKF